MYNEVERACLYVGLDPYMGLYHTERYGKPSLVLDLVEEFRVRIIDSTIFPLFLNKQMEKAENFEPIQPGVYRLSHDGKRKIVEAVYNRFNEQVFWDGKRREVKAVIRHQMQCLAQYFLGKRSGYEPAHNREVVDAGPRRHVTLHMLVPATMVSSLEAPKKKVIVMRVEVSQIAGGGTASCLPYSVAVNRTTPVAKPLAGSDSHRCPGKRVHALGTRDLRECCQ